MKKILSIFMVAVLGLNLLYQPCVAAETDAQTKVGESRKSSLWYDIACSFAFFLGGLTIHYMGRDRILATHCASTRSGVDFPKDKLSEDCLNQTKAFFCNNDFGCFDETLSFCFNLAVSPDDQKKVGKIYSRDV